MDQPANPTTDIDMDEDRIREECGVFGVFGVDRAQA